MTAPPLPPFDAVEIEFPLKGQDWSIVPDVRQNRWQWALGHPLELRPFRYDFLTFWCKEHLTLQPHYDKSTWDTFWIDATGFVKAEGLGGLFPITLGQQPKLLAGIRTLLAALPPAVPADRPEVVTALEKIHAQFGQPQLLGFDPLHPPPPPPPPPGMRGGLTRAFWRWKLGGDAEDLLQRPDLR